MPGVTVRKPTWSTSSFVLYVGAFTVLGAAAGALVFFSSRYGDAAFAAWTLLPLAVLYAIAHAFRRGGEWLSAGLFIVADMVVWIAFLGALESWWGWLPDEQDAPFAGWHWGLWLLLVVTIVTAAVDLRQFRFPLLVIFPAALSWFLVVDVLSGGGSWAAVLTLILGLVYFAIGGSLDGGPGRPYGFWMHVAAGLLVGGALFYWWHSSTLDWALVAATGIVFVGLARATRRSSWAVLGIAGFLGATAYFAQKWSTGHGLLTLTGGYEPVEIRAWVPPLVFGVVGLFLVLLGLSARERREEPAA
jgi:hypothetical protein